MSDSSIVKCTCCESTLVGGSIQFFDSDQIEIRVQQCSNCAAFVPHYSEPVTNNLEDQVTFHQSFWQHESSQSLNNIARNQRHMVRRLSRRLGEPGKSRVAEIGCGRGTLLKALLDENYDAIGCEPSDELNSKARLAFGFDEDLLSHMTGLEFCLTQLAKERKFDAIILWHVIEHIDAPISLLKLIKDLLSDNGKVILQVPLLYRPYVYPEHRYLCNRANIKRMADLSGLHLIHYGWSAHEFFSNATLATMPSKGNSVQVHGDFISDWQLEQSEIAKILINNNAELRSENPEST